MEEIPWIESLLDDSLKGLCALRHMLLELIVRQRINVEKTEKKYFATV